MLNIYVDRGGTFTDFYYEFNDIPHQFKILSEEQYQDGVTEGIKRICKQHPDGTINKVVIGTTLVTNALLERKGYKCALFITEGFRDLLQIGQQTRPKIFDLSMKKPDVLYSKVYEITERISHTKEVLLGLDIQQVKMHLQNAMADGIESIGVVLLHSSINNVHEQQIKQIANEMGIKNIQISSDVSQSIKIIPRGQTTIIDAYINPLLQVYVEHVQQELQAMTSMLPQTLYMTSDGGLVRPNEFTGSKAILSGPAAGVVGIIQTSNIFRKLGKQGVVGFDMGGTSTDVCVYYDDIPIKDELLVDGILVNSPCFDITTVAAGGGSLLQYENGMFKVGPQSSGAKPGPICYGRNGKLSVTDANLYLNHINKEHMPQIFGPNNDSPLDQQSVVQAFEELGKQLNINSQDVASGFIRMADEQMSQPIRTLTAGRGRQSSDHMLYVFGGAGAQHCCQVADILSIDTIYIHKYASIFSAYGLSKARQQTTKTIPLIGELTITLMKDIQQIISKLTQDNIQDYDAYGDDYQHRIILKLKYQGSDCLLDIDYNVELQQIYTNFIIKHTELFGFELQRQIMIDYVQVITQFGKNLIESDDFIEYPQTQGQNMRVQDLGKYSYVGPCLIFTGSTTIKVNNGWAVQTTINNNIIIRKIQQQQIQQQQLSNIVQLSLFANRFMSIAEDMGKQLQNTAISTNIKERLDFSCAIFDKYGNLVANAPHLPVHLGSMSDAVKCQLGNFNIGDVIMSNHPEMGGSHLPDITVISPVYHKDQIIFYTASRGHHADVGGKSPGSMPAFSNFIFEEGVSFKSFKVVENGNFMEDELRKQLLYPIQGIGSREISDNISDIKAQIAANLKGIDLLNKLVQEHGLDMVQQQMEQIQHNSEESVRNMLVKLSLAWQMDEVGIVSEQDYMDDGSVIKLKLVIDRINRNAVFDFTGTSGQVIGNINCPRSVTKSAIIYCLRCLVDMDIPLNQGCLVPTSIILPQYSLLDPHQDCAIVGGNVLTSQRITDIILKCFRATAASQGCMNNFSFGGNQCNSYYETIAGGSGASDTFKGESGVQVHMTNTRITDIEVIERRYPVRVTKFTLRPNSGGYGRNAGGNGVIRQFQFLHPVIASLLTERRVFAPFGLEGGLPGSKGMNILTRNGNEFVMPSKVEIQVQTGDIITILTPGGGGYGLK